MDDELRKDILSHVTGESLPRWSACTWTWLHSVTFLHGAAVDSARVHRMTHLLSRVMPCEDCSVHFAKYVGEFLPTEPGEVGDWQEWYVTAHNAVNTRLHTTVVTFQSVVDTYADTKARGTLETQTVNALWQFIWTISALAPDQGSVLECIALCLAITYPDHPDCPALIHRIQQIVVVPTDGYRPLILPVYDVCVQTPSSLQSGMFAEWNIRIVRYSSEENRLAWVALMNGVLREETRKWSLVEDMIGDTYRPFMATEHIDPAICPYISRNRYHHKIEFMDLLSRYKTRNDTPVLTE